MLTPSGQSDFASTLADWPREPSPPHKERPRHRITGMKKCAAFPGGALTDFWFPKRGVGGSARPLARCSARNAGGGAIVFLHLSSFAMRCTVPVPMPSDLATFKIEAAIGRCREILDDLQKPKTVGLQAAVEATRSLLPKLEADLKALTKAYNTKRKIGAR